MREGRSELRAGGEAPWSSGGTDLQSSRDSAAGLFYQSARRARKEEEEKYYPFVWFLLIVGPEGKIRCSLSILVFSGNPFIS